MLSVYDMKLSHLISAFFFFKAQLQLSFIQQIKDSTPLRREGRLHEGGSSSSEERLVSAFA